VDGNTDGRGEGQSITSIPAPEEPWWEVDLGASQPISYIEVWPRIDDCCLDRLHNFNVFVSNDELPAGPAHEAWARPGVGTFYVLGRADSPATVDVHRAGRYVRVQMAQPGPMDLAEVRVWGALRR
jgi:hypothetical protein